MLVCRDNRNLYQTAAQAEKVEKDERRAERELAQEQKDPLSAVRPVCTMLALTLVVGC